MNNLIKTFIYIFFKSLFFIYDINDFKIYILI